MYYQHDLEPNVTLLKHDGEDMICRTVLFLVVYSESRALIVKKFFWILESDDVTGEKKILSGICCVCCGHFLVFSTAQPHHKYQLIRSRRQRGRESGVSDAVFFICSRSWWFSLRFSVNRNQCLFVFFFTHRGQRAQLEPDWVKICPRQNHFLWAQHLLMCAQHVRLRLQHEAAVCVT